jgi:conjugal transfer mating pair stabilization protein TraN
MRSTLTALCMLLCWSLSTPAQQICTSDVDASGGIDQPDESRACSSFAGLFNCPIQAQACVDNGGTFTCPINGSLACSDDGSGTQMCSPHACFDPNSRPPVITDPTTGGPTAAPVDPIEGCLGQLRLFSGYPLRCRRSGTQTVFQSCCSEGSPKSISDSMGEIGERSQQGEYVALIGVGASIAVSQGTQAASNFLTASFDPTTMSTASTVFLLDQLVGNQCDAQDIQTAQLRNSGYCVDVGTYCAEEWPLVGCVQRAVSTCCFNSLLARIIHQQGRPQIPSIGGFGTPEAPNCRGFTPDEFRSLDFSKIDLSEYATELRHRTQGQMQNELQNQSTIRLTPR